MIQNFPGGPLPKLTLIRHVPTRYQCMLPLGLMKHYQCIIVGAERGTLTLAIADARQEKLIEFLEKLTGYPIFTVLIDSARMNLLLERLERREQQKCREVLGRPCYVHKAQLQAYIPFVQRYYTTRQFARVK